MTDQTSETTQPNADPAPDASAAAPGTGPTDQSDPSCGPTADMAVQSPLEGPVTLTREAYAQAIDAMNAIEADALFWGGEVGTRIRNNICRVRELLGAGGC